MEETGYIPSFLLILIKHYHYILWLPKLAIVHCF